MSKTPEKGFEWIKGRIDSARDNFIKHESVVAAASIDTLNWLKKNNRYYQPDGSTKHGKWWGDLGETDDDVLADIRSYAFRCHLYDNGIRRMISNLMDKGIIPDDDKMSKNIKFAVDYPTMGLHHELVGYRAAQRNKSLTLADVSRRFDLVNAVKLRDNRLVPMADLGMWECRADNTGHGISIGSVAYHFHVNAFIVLMKNFDPKIGKL